MSIPEVIIRQLSAIDQEVTRGGILLKLSKLLNAIRMHYKSFMENLDAQYRGKVSAKTKARKEALMWMEERLTFLKGIMPVECLSITRAYELIVHRKYDYQKDGVNFVSSSLDIACEAFSHAVNDVITSLPSRNPTDFDGWVTIDHSGSTCYVQVAPPPHLRFLLCKKTFNIKEWAEWINNDPLTLYELLKTLSEYPGPLALPLSSILPKDPQTWEEHDNALDVYNRQLFLDKFKPNNQPRSSMSLERERELPHEFLNLERLKGLAHTLVDMASETPMGKGTKAIKDRSHKDREKVKQWMRCYWGKNPTASTGTVIAQLQLAIGKGEIELSRDYKDSTYQSWAKSVDLAPVQEKQKRRRARNR